MRHYLAEAYLSSARTPNVGQIAERLRTAAQAMSANGVAVRFRHSLVVPGDETCFHIFEAVSATAVRQTGERAGVDLLRVVEMHHAGGPTSW